MAQKTFFLVGEARCLLSSQWPDSIVQKMTVLCIEMCLRMPFSQVENCVLDANFRSASMHPFAGSRMDRTGFQMDEDGQINLVCGVELIAELDRTRHSLQSAVK